MLSNMILGLGTGRCGTRSLSCFLSSQPGMVVLHEGTLRGRDHPLHWEGDQDRVLAWVKRLPEILGHPAYTGDVGMYFLPYCELLMQRCPAIRFVCVERDRAEVVESFLRHLPDRHPWLRHDGDRWRKDLVWDSAYPKFDEPDKGRAAGLYWDLYKAEVDRLVTLHPDSIRRFRTETLNSPAGRNEILDFIGYTGVRRLDGPFHTNARHGPARTLARVGFERAVTASRPYLAASIRHMLWEHVARHVHAWLRDSGRCGAGVRAGNSGRGYRSAVIAEEDRP